MLAEEVLALEQAAGHLLITLLVVMALDLVDLLAVCDGELLLVVVMVVVVVVRQVVFYRRCDTYCGDRKDRSGKSILKA